MQAIANSFVLISTNSGECLCGPKLQMNVSQVEKQPYLIPGAPAALGCLSYSGTLERSACTGTCGLETL
jgi:hypothetical protein